MFADCKTVYLSAGLLDRQTVKLSYWLSMRHGPVDDVAPPPLYVESEEYHVTVRVRVFVSGSRQLASVSQQST